MTKNLMDENKVYDFPAGKHDRTSHKSECFLDWYAHVWQIRTNLQED